MDFNINLICHLFGNNAGAFRFHVSLDSILLLSFLFSLLSMCVVCERMCSCSFVRMCVHRQAKLFDFHFYVSKDKQLSFSRLHKQYHSNESFGRFVEENGKKSLNKWVRSRLDAMFVSCLKSLTVRVNVIGFSCR